MNRQDLRNFLTYSEVNEIIKHDKADLVKNGIFGDFLKSRKNQYNEGMEPNEDPKFYGMTEYEKELCDSLMHSKKCKKKESRIHVRFMHDFYDNIGFLTLTFSDAKIGSMTYECMRKKVCEVLNNCFDDFIGRPELSKSGRIHFHFIVAWNGPVATRDVYREGKTNKLVLNKKDLQELWFGEWLDDKTPSKYGVYDLILLRNLENEDLNKTSNYIMKSLYTMESYITKQDEEDFSQILDDELLFKINSSNIVVARNTPYQAWRRDQKEQDRYIKRRARIFESSFYEKNKFGPKKNFREWAEKRKGTLLVPIGQNGEPLYMIPNDYKTVQIDDYKENTT